MTQISFKVPMPEAGPYAYLEMDIKAMAQLEHDFGEDYYEIVSRGFIKPSPIIVSRALACCLKDGDDDGAPWGLSIEQLGLRLYDAQIRALKGMTLADAMQMVHGKGEAA